MINKLPEVIKCIIFDYVGNTLNYQIELHSDKFIGNPIDVYRVDVCIFRIKKYYHLNNLTKIKTPLHFIGLRCENMPLPPQEILNKLQKFRFANDYETITELLGIKILSLHGIFTEIHNFKGLLELECIGCNKLTEIPNIVGLKKLNCSVCINLTKIPNIVGLLKLSCSYCVKLTEIPNIVGLLELQCAECYKLTEIPHIEGLLKLNCHNIFNTPKIPNIKGLFLNNHRVIIYY